MSASKPGWPGQLVIYTLADEAANQLYQASGTTLWYRGYLASARSPHNHVSDWQRFTITPNRELTLLDPDNQPIADARDQEVYYVGQAKAISRVEAVAQVRTE